MTKVSFNLVSDEVSDFIAFVPPNNKAKVSKKIIVKKFFKNKKKQSG